MKLIGSSGLDPQVRRAIQGAAGQVGALAATVADLPSSAPEGTLAYSRSTKMLYIYDGSWVAVVGAWA
jgi:hypothetical protein